MIKFLLRRMIQTIPVIFLLSIVVFGLIFLIPGDPIVAMLGPAAQVDQAAVERMRAELNLDQPIYIQYVTWLGRALQGDFGRSISSKQPVAQALLNRLPVTAQLALFAISIALLIALPLGVLAATRRNSRWDVAASFISAIGVALPNFWLAILFILLFAVHLRWLPASGYVSPGVDFLGWMRHSVLPALALGGSAAAGLMRHIRSSLLEVLQDDYIRTARAKGLTNRRVLIAHALRNSLIPVVTVLGLTFGGLMGGSLIIESIFLIPGVGSLMVNAIFTRDFPVVQAGAMVLAVVVIFTNFLVDFLYGYLDPRIRQH